MHDYFEIFEKPQFEINVYTQINNLIINFQSCNWIKMLIILFLNKFSYKNRNDCMMLSRLFKKII